MQGISVIVTLALTLELEINIGAAIERKIEKNDESILPKRFAADRRNTTSILKKTSP